MIMPTPICSVRFTADGKTMVKNRERHYIIVSNRNEGSSFKKRIEPQRYGRLLQTGSNIVLLALVCIANK